MKKIVFLFFFYSLFQIIFAHPMPNSVVNLSIKENYVGGEAKMPLIELENALKESPISSLDNSKYKEYFQNHIAASSENQKWKIEILGISLISDKDSMIGVYQEVVVKFKLIPPKIAYLRAFSLQYDAIIHQVITHKIMVFVHEDWKNGILAEEKAQQVGVIEMDIRSGNIYPLNVKLEKGNDFKGFMSMFYLGMKHIKEGLDHLLFLFSLLLISPLIANGKEWSLFQGTKYTLKRFLFISLSFTIGHSITLLIGSFNLLIINGRYIEILIALSIFISGINAIKPIFNDKETWVAAGFGLIHGLAFSFSLAGLELNTGAKLISILGFNLGIEAMQFMIMVLFTPLFLMSKYAFYHNLRIILAIFTCISATAWFFERLLGQPNFVSAFLATLI